MDRSNANRSTVRSLNLSAAVFALSSVATLCGPTALASEKYWAGGNGTWSTYPTHAKWYTNANGTGGLASWVSGDTAFFSAGTGATGAFTVTLYSTQAVAGINVEEGTVTLTGPIANYSANVGGGTVTVRSGATLVTDDSVRISMTSGGRYVLDGGTLRTTNVIADKAFVDVDAKIVLGAAGGTFDYQVTNTLNIIETSTPVSGSGSLTKTGAGVLAFSSPSTYTGGTFIRGGELRVRGAADRLPVTTGVTVYSGAVLNLNGLNQKIASLSGSGNVGTGSGTLTIEGAASTTFSGAIKNIANAGAKAVTAGKGNLVKNGLGVVTFSGPNDITGSVTLNDGGIVVNTGASLAGTGADLTVNGGRLTLVNAAQAIRNLAGAAGEIDLGPGHVLTTDPLASTTYAGEITGAGGLVKANALAGSTPTTLTLTGANTYAGGTTVSGGTVAADNGSSGMATGSGLVTVDALSILTTTTGGAVGPVLVKSRGTISAVTGKTLVVDGNATIAGTSSGDVDYRGNIVLDGGLISDTLTISSGKTLSGSGTVTGDLTIDGTLAPGASPGTLTVNGDLTLGGFTDMELAGTATNLYDRVIVSEDLHFGGVLNVTLDSTFAPVIGDSFDLFNFARSTGAFSAISLPKLRDPTWCWDTSLLYSDGTIAVQAVPLPAGAWAGITLLGGLAGTRIRRRIGRAGPDRSTVRTL